MIVRLPSKLCTKCMGKGWLEEKEKAINTFVIVCGCITKNGKQEVMTLKAYNKRVGKLKRRVK